MVHQLQRPSIRMLQEILVLLATLADSSLGRSILSQPACVSRLLALLLEPQVGNLTTEH